MIRKRQSLLYMGSHNFVGCRGCDASYSYEYDILYLEVLLNGTCKTLSQMRSSLSETGPRKRLAQYPLL